MTLHPMMDRRKVFAALLMISIALPNVLLANPKRVLIMNPFGRDVAPFSTLISSFRTTLANEAGEPIDFHEVSLDLARYTQLEMEETLVAYIESRIKKYPIDLVVPFGGQGVQFCNRNRDRLFPDIPILVVGSDPRLIPPTLMQTNVALVTLQINIPRMIDDILQLQPQTTNIAVVLGSSALERFWAGELQRELSVFTNRIGFTWINNQPLVQILEHCAALPPNSFILHGLFVIDATGIPCEKSEVLRKLHASANAPVYGLFQSEFGLGIIGGHLYHENQVGIQGAHTAIRILRGERPEQITPQIAEKADPVYDWRELKRWGISESRLPEKSTIHFRQPDFWTIYRWPIAGSIVFCLFQFILIAGLINNLVSRRRAEAATRDLSGRLIHAHEQERARLGRELHDDITQRIGRLAIDAGLAEHVDSKQAGPHRLRSIREGLIRLSEDVHALSYRLHPSVLEDLGLTEALRTECERFSRQESIATDVNLEDTPSPIQSETALCLFRVAQESLRNIIRHAQAGKVGMALKSRKDGLLLTIHDDGNGFNPAGRRDHPSLGLASMKERVLLLGGTLDINSIPGKGTTVQAWVPIKKGDAS